MPVAERMPPPCPCGSLVTAIAGSTTILLSLKAWSQGYRNPVWMTFKQAKDLGGMVRKGEKSSLVVKYGTFETKEDAPERRDAEAKTRGYLESLSGVQYAADRRARGSVSDAGRSGTHWQRGLLSSLSHIAANMIENMGVGYEEGGDRACYIPSKDHVHMPEVVEIQRRRVVLFDPVSRVIARRQATSDRCDRTKEKAGSKFGNAAYAMEELVAEISSAMIGAQLGFEPGHIEDSAAYVQSWLNVLRNDKRAIVKAAAAAQRSADYLMEQAGESAEAA